jgi:outer membrane protein TolC
MPLTPLPEQLPQAVPVGTVDRLVPTSPGDTLAALARRPELRLLRTAFERAQNRVALARNSIKPRVDLSVVVARDLGDIAEGGLSRDGTETILGVSFSVPLQQRSARGRIRQETAELEAIELRQRLREDQITVEIENILVDLNAAEGLLQLAADQVGQTEQVREAEQRRFGNGASDFFLVNLREEAAASARIQYYTADLERHIARANYDAAVVDMERLGLDERP